MHDSVNLPANHCLPKLSDLQLSVDIFNIMVLPYKTFTLLMRDWFRMMDINPSIIQIICHFSKRCAMFV